MQAPRFQRAWHQLLQVPILSSTVQGAAAGASSALIFGTTAWTLKGLANGGQGLLGHPGKKEVGSGSGQPRKWRQRVTGRGGAEWVPAGSSPSSIPDSSFLPMYGPSSGGARGSLPPDDVLAPSIQHSLLSAALHIWKEKQ